MKIPSRGPSRPAPTAKPSTSTPTSSDQPDQSKETPVERKPPPWRRITLNEAAVEIPQGMLELAPPSNATAATGLQAGVSLLAAVRAAQCFHDAASLEEYLEGASSAALAAAGAASLFPGQVAAHTSNLALFGHGSFELALGIREISEELKKEKPARLELLAGVVDAAKGASTFVPLLAPTLETPVGLFQLAAVLGKTVLETQLDR